MVGCDIHCYMEYRWVPKTVDEAHEASEWQSFGARINPGRHYQVFNRLAGVRGPGDGALIAPRGIAPALGYEAAGDLLLRVHDRPMEDAPVNWDEKNVTRVHADSWVQSGNSVRVTYHKQEYVTNPDYHTHSWLTLGEYLGVLVDLKARGCEADVGYWALAGALTVFDQRGYEARVVFWFDN